MTELSKKSLLLVKICNMLLAEEMDKIKQTSAYKQDIKNLVNKLSEKLDREYFQTYKLFQDDSGSELGFNYSISILENFVDRISKAKTVEEMIVFNEKLKTI